MDELIIEAGRTEAHYWRDLWRYRELFFILAWRDVSVRYKQTVIGAAWAFIRPFLTMVVFTVLFGHLAKLATNSGVPYAIIVFSGLLPWTLFSSVLGDVSSSVISNSHLISKVYFPRMIVPLATVVVALIDFAVTLVILVGLMIFYRFVPDWHILLLPLFLLLALMASLGPALWAASLVVKYRDFRFIIPFALQFGLYVSPVGFSSTVVPEHWRWLYSLNPVVGVIDGFRWSIIGGESPIYWPGFVVSIAVMLFFLWRWRSLATMGQVAFCGLVALSTSAIAYGAAVAAGTYMVASEMIGWGALAFFLVLSLGMALVQALELVETVWRRHWMREALPAAQMIERQPAGTSGWTSMYAAEIDGASLQKLGSLDASAWGVELPQAIDIEQPHAMPPPRDQSLVLHRAHRAVDMDPGQPEQVADHLLRQRVGWEAHRRRQDPGTVGSEGLMFDDSVDHHRRILNLRNIGDRERPSRGKLRDVRFVDLLERGVTVAAVVAVIIGPIRLRSHDAIVTTVLAKQHNLLVRSA